MQVGNGFVSKESAPRQEDNGEASKRGKEGGREERLTDKHCFIGIACLCSQLVV